MRLPKLLDCPFCGGIPTLGVNKDASPEEWMVVCSLCGGSIRGPIHTFVSMEEAARAWNTRGGIYVDPDR